MYLLVFCVLKYLFFRPKWTFIWASPSSTLTPVIMIFQELCNQVACDRCLESVLFDSHPSFSHNSDCEIGCQMLLDPSPVVSSQPSPPKKQTSIGGNSNLFCVLPGDELDQGVSAQPMMEAKYCLNWVCVTVLFFKLFFIWSIINLFKFWFGIFPYMYQLPTWSQGRHLLVY